MRSRSAVPRPGWRSVQLVLALMLLNASLCFVNVWPTPRIRPDLALSVELAAVVLLLAAFPSAAQRVRRGLLPTLWVVLIIGRYADVTGPGLYGREFNLYWDSAHLGNVVAMLARAVPVPLLVLGTLVATMLLGTLWWVSRLAWSRVAEAAAAATTRRALAATALVVVTLFIGQTWIGADGGPVRFASPVSRSIVRQARYVAATASPVRVLASRGGVPALANARMTALDGGDVVLAFVEAYGMVTYEHAGLADALAPARAELQAAVEDTGRTAVSAVIESPTFGASSWLAHLTLLTGIEVRDQYAYVGVMASGLDTLPKAFRRQGYRSIALMPGMRQAWPEGAFYGFDQIYGRDALDYGGPRFGWWSIPDQFTLARLDALELTTGPRPPRFVVFPTSTTHAPFGPVAPYQPDWARLLGPHAFDGDSVARAMAATPDLTNLAPSYARAMSYELTTFAGWLREHADDRLVLLLIGDHQPVAAVTGPGASYHVPMHVIAPPGPVHDRLRAAGFIDGLTPAGPALLKMHAVVPILMDAFR